MKIKLIKQWFANEYVFHITNTEKNCFGKDYDYVDITVKREPFTRNSDGSIAPQTGADYRESDARFEERATKLFNEFLEKQKDIKLNKGTKVLKEISI